MMRLYLNAVEVGNLAVSGNTATIDLTDVTTPQRLVLKLAAVSDGSQTGDVPVAMNVVVGDANGSGGVTASDISQVKASSGVTVSSGNFRADVNANGTISSSDVGLVKSTAGVQLSP
ncbi:MAG: dockerin type I domain-containing protein [Chthoniobacterales bacterium]